MTFSAALTLRSNVSRSSCSFSDFFEKPRTSQNRTEMFFSEGTRVSRPSPFVSPSMTFGEKKELS